jgi:acyl carrier protein
MLQLFHGGLMSMTLFYERRTNSDVISFKDRRTTFRRQATKTVSEEKRRTVSYVRRHNRETIKIPVRLQIPGKEVMGYTHDISLDGLRVFTDTVLSEDTPMTLQFSFGDSVCQLNLSGKVVFCQVSDKGGSPHRAIGIKFSAIRDFEQQLLMAAIQGLRQSAAIAEKSTLNILASKASKRVENPNDSNESKATELAKSGIENSLEMYVSPGSVDQMESLITFFDRRKFELPVSFASRRKGPRRKKYIPSTKERRMIEEEHGPLKDLKEKIAGLKTPPRESIKVILGEISGIDPNSVKESSKLRLLGLDSFQLIEMLAAVETVYNISLDEGAILRVVTIRDLIDQIEASLVDRF